MSRERYWLTPKGNLSGRFGNRVVTVFPRGSTWRWSIREGEEVRYAPEQYATEVDAWRGAFEAAGIRCVSGE